MKAGSKHQPQAPTKETRSDYFFEDYVCLAHGGEQDGQVGTQVPTREAFNNYSFFFKGTSRVELQQKIEVYYELKGQLGDVFLAL